MKGENMLTKRALLVFTEVVLAVSIIGCAPTIMVGTDGGVYQCGKLYAVSDKSMDAVYEASLQAMDKLELKVTDKMKDVFGAKVVAKTSDDKRIVVTITPTKDKKTRYNICADGNAERSQTIFMEINKLLLGQK
jgi:hypothetical protein